MRYAPSHFHSMNWRKDPLRSRRASANYPSGRFINGSPRDAVGCSTSHDGMDKSRDENRADKQLIGFIHLTAIWNAALELTGPFVIRGLCGLIGNARDPPRAGPF